MSNVKVKLNDLDKSDNFICDENQDTEIRQIYNFKLENPTKFIVGNQNLNCLKENIEAKNEKMNINTKIVKIELMNNSIEQKKEINNTDTYKKGSTKVNNENNKVQNENKLYLKESGISLYIEKYNKQKPSSKTNSMNRKVSFQHSTQKQASLINQLKLFSKKNKSMEDFFEDNTKLIENTNNDMDNLNINKYNKEQSLSTFQSRLSQNAINTLKELNKSCDKKKSNCYYKVKTQFFSNLENINPPKKNKQNNLNFSRNKFSFKSFSKKNLSRLEKLSNKSLQNNEFLNNYKNKSGIEENQITNHNNKINIKKDNNQSMEARSLSSSIFYETLFSQAETRALCNLNNENLKWRNHQSQKIQNDKSLSIIEKRFDEQMNNLKVKKMLSFDEYINFLLKIDILNYDTKDPEEVFLRLKLFEILGGSTNNIITTQNLINALKIILRVRKVKRQKKEDIHLNDLKLNFKKDKEKINLEEEFLNKNGELIISDKVILFLQNTFYPFYLKKLTKKQDNYNFFKVEKNKVNIYERSNSSNAKIKKDYSETQKRKNPISNINNILNQRKNSMKDNILKKKTKSEFEEIYDCTFHPNTTKIRSKRASLHPNIVSGFQRKDCKHNIMNEKRNLAKELKQCSFHPFLYSSKKYLQSGIPKKSMEIINRLKAAREKFEQRLVNLNLRNDNISNYICNHRTLNQEKYNNIHNIFKGSKSIKQHTAIGNNFNRKDKIYFHSSSNHKMIQNKINESQVKAKQSKKNSKKNLDENIKFDSSISRENNSEFNFCESEEEQEEIPLMFLDINLGKGILDRIVVYDGDTSEELASEFCKMHSNNKIDLNSLSQKKLEGLIRDQIRKLLNKIDEEGQSEEDQSEFY